MEGRDGGRGTEDSGSPCGGGGCILHGKVCNLPRHCLEQDYPICDLPESILSSCFTPWSLPHSLAPWPEERGIGEGS